MLRIFLLLLYTWTGFLALCLLFLAMGMNDGINFIVGGVLCAVGGGLFVVFSHKFAPKRHYLPRVGVIVSGVMLIFAVFSHMFAYSPSDFLRLVDSGTYESTVVQLAHDNARGLWTLTDAKLETTCTGYSSVDQGEGDYAYTYAHGLISKDDPKVGVWLVGKKEVPSLIKGVVGKNNRASGAVINAAKSKGCTISEDAPILLMRAEFYSEGLALVTALIWMIVLSVLSLGILKHEE